MKGCAIVLVEILSGAAGKVLNGVLGLSSQNTEVYLGKFSFVPHARASIKGNFHTDSGVYFDNHPHELTLCLYSDEEWVKYRRAMHMGSLCSQRRALASWAEKVVPRYIQVAGHPPKHDFSFSSHLRLPNNRTHYWFVVIMDCYIEEYDAHPPPMRYSLSLLNGNSHLPAGARIGHV